MESFSHKKVDVGRKLGITENLIIQGLNGGPKAEYHNVIIVHTPTTVTDWYIMVSKLVVVPSPSNSPVRYVSESVRSSNPQLIRLGIGIGLDYQNHIFSLLGLGFICI